MQGANHHAQVRPIPERVEAPSLPAWVHRAFAGAVCDGAVAAPLNGLPNEDLTLELRETNEVALVTVRVPDAATLPPLSLQRRTVEAYTEAHRALKQRGSWHPIRIWNCIPGIHTAQGEGIDRYMVFNAGRFAAYHEWYESDSAMETLLPTATGVGCDGTNLVIHLVAARNPAVPVENPRQTRSYRYSDHYGPMPPCFARGSIVTGPSGGLPDLLLGGTSSISGEETIHAGDAAAQAAETLENIAHLIAEAVRIRHNCPGSAPSAPQREQLRRLDSLRIYHCMDSSLDEILDIVWPRVDHLDPSGVEIVRATICRPELLVEIEGTASLA